MSMKLPEDKEWFLAKEFTTLLASGKRVLLLPDERNYSVMSVGCDCCAEYWDLTKEELIQLITKTIQALERKIRQLEKEEA